MKTTTIIRIALLAFMPAFLLQACRSAEEDSKANKTEVVVYGGTSGGVMTAVQVAQMGHEVILIAPHKHLGGMSSSGLGFTDTGNKAVIGGLSREFYQRVYTHYQDTAAWNWQKKSNYGNRGQGTKAIDGDKRTMWIFEPHVAEKLFDNFVKENDIKIYRQEKLDRQNGVAMQNGRIQSVSMLSGKTFCADMFVDATYEGDLMAAAGVSYHVGRESTEKYDEKWNGVQKGVFHHGHHFKSKISPYKEPGVSTSGVLPRISTEDPGKNGSGDKKIQAYCFRTCLTKVDANKVPIPKPESYDPSQYELLLRVYEHGWRETFRKFDAIPNHKTDVNNHGPFSFDNIGKNYDYPEASYERRQEIVEEHRQYQQGLLYFLGHNPRMPDEVHNEMKKWGLAADEFEDNNHWPYQLYIREARRMKGEFVMTEHEVMGRRDVPHPVGMGSYTMDSHNTQRYITKEGYVQNEGDIGVHPPKPYQIAMGALLPKEEDCRNLLVPVAVSSSHIAFGSIRMEPVFMILGQSAGTMAGLALEQEIPIHQLAYSDLRKRLLKDGQVLEYPR